MNPIVNIALIVSFVLKESTSTTPAFDSTTEYDITSLINEAIIKTFQSVNPHASMRLISRMENRDSNKYETKITQRLPPFGNKIFFHDINISIWEPSSKPKMYCDFHKNKTRIFNDELIFKVVGMVDTAPRKPYVSFKTHLKFKDISISAVESSKGLFNNQFQINFSYSRLMYNYLTLPWTRDNIPTNKHEKLIKRIKTIVPTMVHDNINRNEKFLHVLHSSFCHNPKQRIISSYPHFPSNEDQYYYLVPKISFFGVNLVNMKIKGLSNFESLRPNITFGNTAYTLLVKKIKGSMNLDNKEFENLSFHEMKFDIDYLFITVDFETKRLVVEAKDYKVIQANTKPPRESIFATAIMQNIEAAIAYSIMPSLEVSVSNEQDESSITNDTKNPSQLITDPSTDSDLTDTTRSSEITQKRKYTTPWSRYARFSRAMFKYAFEKSFQSSSRSSSTPSTTEIATTLKMSTTPDTTTTQTLSHTTESSTTRKITTQTPQSSSNSVPQSTKCSTTTETSPKTDFTTTTRSEANSKISQSSSTRDGRSSTSQVQKSDTKTCQSIQQKDNKTTKDSGADTEEEPFDYDISFHNVTIKLISGSPYPKQIQCEFFKNLKIDHQINAIPSGNIRLNNKGNAIDINFHANFTAIEISVVKPGNNSTENATCEFQIHNNQDIKVILPSTKNKTAKNNDLKIKNKIDKTLLSLTTDRITRTVKPLVCLPFDFCSQSIKILDDFFVSFVDNVLKKCSLRRTTTS